MLKLALCQINPVVGDLEGNAHKILRYIEDAKKVKADVAVFCELSLCGYPPEDLLLKEHFIANNLKQLQMLAKNVNGIDAVVGFVDCNEQGRIFNAAALVSKGRVAGVYHKQQLPNYGVFDEKRYFTPGDTPGIFEINGIKVGINICEDIWIDHAAYARQAKANAGVIINISSSPYEQGKLLMRQSLLERRAKEIKTPFVYVNCVGGQDELVFDGASVAVDAKGQVLARARQFQEDMVVVDLASLPGKIPAPLEGVEEIYRALVLGTHDYVAKNGFIKVALGLSGGIDSALVALIAVDAFGKGNVTAVSMPSPYNIRSTRNDARLVARNLGIDFHELPIKRVMAEYKRALHPFFKGTKPNIAEENIQARIRGNMLMALSNKFGWMVLTTGNKSEMAAGYCTLYGDMSGGFAPLKDILKTKVYELARRRNAQGASALIPKSVFMRAPTAELRLNQRDEDSLGAYADLDKVLTDHIENHRSVNQIAGKGLSLAYVVKTVRQTDSSEYKRRQAPPGVKISPRAFGKDWRLPITNKYHE